MRHLPAFLDIADRPCLVIGGGEVAARKIALLERAGGRVHVTSPELVPSLSRDVAAGRIRHLSDRFSPEQLDGSDTERGRRSLPHHQNEDENFVDAYGRLGATPFKEALYATR